MDIEELKKLCPSIFKDKKIQSCKLSDIKTKKSLFNYRGIYLLSDKSGKIVYIGSAYVRDIRSRVLQYQQNRGTGNSTLYKDLIDGGITNKNDAKNYILKLNVSAFFDTSNEYELIKKCGTAVNIAGKK